jgi:DNA-binding transcriptional MerR regulator
VTRATPRPASFTVSTADLAALVGVTFRQVDYWVRVGLLHLAVPVEGSGVRREFDAAEVRVARTVATLYALGVDQDTTRAVAKAVRANPGAIHLPVVVGRYVVEVTDTHVTVTAPLQMGAPAGNGKRRR